MPRQRRPRDLACRSPSPPPLPTMGARELADMPCERRRHIVRRGPAPRKGGGGIWARRSPSPLPPAGTAGRGLWRGGGGASRGEGLMDDAGGRIWFCRGGRRRDLGGVFLREVTTGCATSWSTK